MLIHAWMYCSYYDRLLIMGDDMFIIAYEQAVIMHDQRHIHVIMNIIVNPRGHQTLQLLVHRGGQKLLQEGSQQQEIESEAG